MDVNTECSKEDCEAPLLHASTKKALDAVYRKVAWRLVPVTFLIALVCFVDRTNISLAAIDMAGDVGLTKSQFGVASSLFFVTYMIFQIPSNFVLNRVGGPLWLGVILIGWGFAASATAFVKNVSELYALRLLLGVFEAGTFPGLLYYLTRFFPESRTPMVFGTTLAGCAAGTGISGPLAAGLLSLDGWLHFRGWQWLFLLEGLPAILLGIGVILYLPRSPASAGFLSIEQKSILEYEKAPAKTPVDEGLDWVMYLLKSIVLNRNLLGLLCCGFVGVAMRYVATFWTPLWIDAMVGGNGLDWEKGEKTGSSDSVNSVQVALLSTIPSALAASSGIFFGWTSEKLKDQTIHCSVLWVAGGVSFVLLPWLAGVSVVLGFFALLCGHVGINGVWGPLLSIQLSFMTEENKNFGLAWTNTAVNFSGVLGPMISGFLADQTGSYKSAIWAMGSMTVVGGIAVLLVKDTLRQKHRMCRR